MHINFDSSQSTANCSFFGEKSRGKIMQDCQFCKEKLSKFREGIYDTRFGVEGSFDIYKCNACGLVQLLLNATNFDLKNLYETYYNFGGNKKGLYTKNRKRFLESILYRLWMRIDGDISFHSERGQGHLLDVGCNEGRGLKIYQQNGYTAEGLELNEAAAQRARTKGFTVYTELLETFQSEQLYDVVVLSNVIEHSLDPILMLNHANRILKDRGEIWISCPNVDSWQRKLFGRYWINWHVPFHIVHFSQKTLTNILEKAGFEIQEISQESPALWLAHSIIVRLFAQFGHPTKQLRNPFLVAALLILIRFLFFPLLWIGNRMDRGDCMVVVARKAPK
jgi:2-polyprenyl-3-methyl-5-hydroxy-6-metoxy-1,4-benzoquinol methylase